MYELHGVEFSGNSLKIRMMLGFLGLQCKQISPALKPPGENLLVVNPRGLLPVLVDGDTAVCESNAILVYLSLQMHSEHVSDARRVNLVYKSRSHGLVAMGHQILIGYICDLRGGFGTI